MYCCQNPKGYSKYNIAFVSGVLSLIFFFLVVTNAAPQICYVTEKRGSFWPRVLEDLYLVTAFLLAEGGEGCHTARHRESVVSRDLVPSHFLDSHQ